MYSAESIITPKIFVFVFSVRTFVHCVEKQQVTTRLFCYPVSVDNFTLRC